MSSTPRYFSDPESAVEKIRSLLSVRDWPGLAEYYDLSDSEVTYDELTSGSFFWRDEPPGAAHPAGFWRWRHPFPPEFSHQGHWERDEVTIVEMGISIDQGGGMVQEGRNYFKMTRFHQGYQILPDRPEGDEINPLSGFDLVGPE